MKGAQQFLKENDIVPRISFKDQPTHTVKLIASKSDEIDDGIELYFEDEVFRNVEFYENSDGHYLGEFGEVTITLNENENQFDYSKSSTSEYSEPYTDNVRVKITKDEAKFIKDYVNLNLI